MKDCIDSHDLDQFLNQKDKLLILDFWRPSCGPCRMLSPVLDNICVARPNLAGMKVNTESFPAIAAEFKISAVPTVFFIYNKEVYGKFVGYNTQEDIESYIDEIETKIKNHH